MRQFKNISNSPFTSDAAIILEIRSLFPDFDEPLQKLIAGMAGCSPFLHDLVKKEVNWITKILKSGSSPEETITNEVLQSSNISKSLRVAKARISLWTALQDLSGNWKLEEVSKCLSEFADFSVKVALNYSIDSLIADGKLSKLKNNSDADQLGIFILAMGKLGAWELNYSSDIDLVCFFNDENRVCNFFLYTVNSSVSPINSLQMNSSNL